MRRRGIERVRRHVVTAVEEIDCRVGRIRGCRIRAVVDHEPQTLRGIRGHIHRGCDREISGGQILRKGKRAPAATFVAAIQRVHGAVPIPLPHIVRAAAGDAQREDTAGHASIGVRGCHIDAEGTHLRRRASDETRSRAETEAAGQSRGRPTRAADDG